MFQIIEKKIQILLSCICNSDAFTVLNIIFLACFFEAKDKIKGRNKKETDYSCFLAAFRWSEAAFRFSEEAL